MIVATFSTYASWKAAVNHLSQPLGPQVVILYGPYFFDKVRNFRVMAAGKSGSGFAFLFDGDTNLPPSFLTDFPNAIQADFVG